MSDDVDLKGFGVVPRTNNEVQSLLWRNKETRELINIIKEKNLLALMDNNKYEMSDIIKIIASSLRKKGYDRSHDQVWEKWRHLIYTYRVAMMFHVGLSNRPSKCQHFDLLDDLLRNKYYPNFTYSGLSLSTSSDHVNNQNMEDLLKKSLSNKDKLTAAEKQQRFREKLNQDKERREAYIAQYTKANAKRKKISDLSYEDQMNKRKQWRKWDNTRKEKLKQVRHPNNNVPVPKPKDGSESPPLELNHDSSIGNRIYKRKIQEGKLNDAVDKVKPILSLDGDDQVENEMKLLKCGKPTFSKCEQVMSTELEEQTTSGFIVSDTLVMRNTNLPDSTSLVGDMRDDSVCASDFVSTVLGNVKEVPGLIQSQSTAYTKASAGILEKKTITMDLYRSVTQQRKSDRKRKNGNREVVKKYSEEKILHKITETADDIDLFFRSMANTVKGFSSQEKVEVKRKIFQLVNEIEIKHT